ncbi:uncharacterized protein LOC106710483 [Papilio machaon]|uniref:uncharacterized protein LOC106710483 n=1 Tax=Papilio machaon TaxID=76193 RepID=UPI001E665B72|nr:uncharacterized protein LOC106710483 [Papilio machaon]
MLLQQLWKRGLDWDEPVPEDLQRAWHKIREGFPLLSDLTIPRRVLCDETNNIQLHSFSDASMHAYGACIYLRSINKDGDITVQLLCAKSRVAPTKPPLTIPKLELLGALLAANLSKLVLESLRCPVSKSVHWCDSRVVLAWLNNSPSKLKSFVANKVVEICENTNLSSWRYVPTASNPADYISRGVSPEKLRKLQDWWTGPSFLAMEDTQWPVIEQTNNNNTSHEADLPEMKVLVTIQSDNDPIIKIDNYSQLNRLTRTLAYILRFIHNSKNKNAKITGSLSASELNKSLAYLAKQSQKESFEKEYDALRKGQQLSTNCKITSLNPFLDDDGIMRVGGRLNKSNYSHNKKHPIILDGKHRLTKLIFEREHLRQLHGGPQLILYSVRQTIWPIGGRQLARSTVRACVVCRRHKGQTLTPMMGNLPSERITPAFPFQTIGMDFAGPFNIINKKGRGARVSKCYLCLFICFRYKCVHLEAVSDLSKEAFILALRRLISRRGIPREIYCDNGRNFVAAAKQLGQFIKKNANNLLEFATTKSITFKFQPPYAPHFSGLSEAGIKSAKHLIKRAIGNSHFTFEELCTLFAQVEAILNSRPLSPLSSTPDDYLPLSPGHFLIGRPLTSIPSTDPSEPERPCQTRYELLERVRRQFWKRWQKEYISELQERKRWKKNTPSLAMGDLVIIQEDNTRPLDWRLGRVTQLFPGDDGIARVAEVKTTRGVIRRALTRLCPLLDKSGPEHVRA